MEKRILLGALGGLAVLGLLYGLGFKAYEATLEKPEYSVVKKTKAYQVRRYAPMLVAEVEVDQAGDEGLRQGFMLLAEYIFGGNQAASGPQKIAMTAPVMDSRPSQKIAMTAPVMDQPSPSGRTVSFMMPSQWTESTLPTPNNPSIRFRQWPKRDLAAFRFAGRWSQAELDQKSKEFSRILEEEGVAFSGPTFAFYDPPASLPFFRRNEILFELLP